MSRTYRVGLAVLALLLLVALGVWFGGPPGWAPVDDRAGVVHVADLPGSSTHRRAMHESSGGRSRSARRANMRPAAPAVPQPLEPRAKIDPALVDSTGQIPPGLDSLVVVLRDELVVGRYLRRCAPNFYPNWVGSLLMAQQIQSLRHARAAEYASMRAALVGRYQARIVDSLWVVQAFSVVMSRELVDTLARDPNVSYIERLRDPAVPPFGCLPPATGGLSPRTGCGSVSPDVGDSKSWPATIFTTSHMDAYWSGGFAGGRLALLDTGVDDTHALLDSNPQLGWRVDCSSGNCGGGDPSDMCPHGHGTSSAALLIGDCSDGDAYRGLTDATLDAFRIYAPPTPTQIDTRCGAGSDSVGAGNVCLSSINVVGAGHAVEAALARCDGVIVFETQLGGSDASLLAQCAEQAFSAGAAVIAAVGDGADCQVGSPAFSRTALAVGAYHSVFDNPEDNSVTPVGTVLKPDVLAPSELVTASRDAPQGLTGFGASSGATPVAAAEALMLKNWLGSPSGRVSPGQIYAQMIASSTDPWVSTQPDGFVHKRGAGKVSLPIDGVGWWGVEDVPGQQTVVDNINVSGFQIHTLDAATWWSDPETVDPAGFVVTTHAQVDLSILGPDGQVIPGAVSTSAVSVFQHARVAGGSATLTGSLGICLYNHGPLGTMQRVYWCVVGRRGGPPTP
ncbi:MAG: S8 family serine peptidase [Candidatus Eisenbacteria bacterium]